MANISGPERTPAQETQDQLAAEQHEGHKDALTDLRTEVQTAAGLSALRVKTDQTEAAPADMPTNETGTEEENEGEPDLNEDKNEKVEKKTDR